MGDKLFCVCIIGDTLNIKENLDRNLKFGYITHSIIHPNILIRYGAKNGDGVIIGTKSVIAPDEIMRDHIIIYQICSIGIDDIINDYYTNNPLAALSGEAVPGERICIG